MSKVELPPAIIVDLDGTLCNNQHRRHFVESQPKDRKNFRANIPYDVPKSLVARAVHSFSWDHEIILLTGRDEADRQVTEDWLWEHCPSLGHHLLLMCQDSTPDMVFKEGIYISDIKPNWDVKLVIEDRSRVVQMWRKLGLEVWQVEEGNF